MSSPTHIKHKKLHPAANSAVHTPQSSSHPKHQHENGLSGKPHQEPPPRKDKDKDKDKDKQEHQKEQQKQKQQQQKKKKTSQQNGKVPSSSSSSSKHASGSGGPGSSLKRSLVIKDSDEEDEEEEDDEADVSGKGGPAVGRLKKKQKKEPSTLASSASKPASPSSKVPAAASSSSSRVTTTSKSNTSSSNNTTTPTTKKTDRSTDDSASGSTYQTTAIPTVTSSAPLTPLMASLPPPPPPPQLHHPPSQRSNGSTSHSGHRLILRLPSSRGPSPNPPVPVAPPSTSTTSDKPAKRKYVKKKLTDQAKSSSTPTTTTTTTTSSTSKTTKSSPKKKKKASTTADDKHSNSKANTKDTAGTNSVLSSPLSSVDSDLPETRQEGEADTISDLEIGQSLPFVTYDATFSSDSDYDEDDDEDMYDFSDDDDDVDVDDDSNIESEEERFLIADELRKKGRRSARNSKLGSPTLSNGQPHPLTDDEDSLEMIGSQHHEELAESQQGSVLLEIARLNRRVAESDHHRRRGRHSDDPVTWSGAEESDLDDLDELLGFTADDSAVILGDFEDTDGDDNQTMRFEDFLAQDDGDDESESGSSSSSSSSTSSGNSSDDEASEGDFNDDHVDLGDIQSIADTPREDQMTDMEDEHLSISKDVVSQGGFVFYKTGASDESTDEELSEEEVMSENDGGDTTDTLDDSDHIGLLRFGIEAADEDDEDAEEALAAARRDRNLIDARNMGLSISFNALANHPKTVINKTARTLGVAPETAAKILTSVGMSILFNNGSIQSQPIPAEDAAEEEEKEEESIPKKGRGKQRLPPRPVGMDEDTPSEATATAKPSTTTSKPEPSRTLKPNAPILGNFEPAGEADLCVVVSNDAPAPSPFSARKRRRTRRLTDGSVSPRRGQSVVSSISSRSMGSAAPYHSSSSDEPLYNVLVDLDELVDARMLPSGMSDVSEEDDDVDDDASVSTALGGIHPVGDVSRWSRIPIGAFRSQNHTYTSLATAIFSASRDPAIANNLSFHGGVAVSNSKHRKKRYIPVSPVLFPVGQPLKSISNAKSRKERRKERKQQKDSSSAKTPKAVRRHTSASVPTPGASANRESGVVDGGATGSTSASVATQQRQQQQQQQLSHQPPPSISVSSPFVVPDGPMPSLPSDGLSHYVSPLFSGVGSGLQIPPLSL